MTERTPEEAIDQCAAGWRLHAQWQLGEVTDEAYAEHLVKNGVRADDPVILRLRGLGPPYIENAYKPITEEVDAMADRTMSATAFIDFCAFMGYPRADVVKGLVEDYGYDTDTATLAVEGAYEQQGDLDLENATDDQSEH